MALVVVSLLAVSFVALLLWPTGGLGSVERAVLQLMSPVQYALTHAGESIADLFGSLRNVARVREENEALLEQVRALRTQLQIAREAQIENEVLRGQLGFAQANPSYEVLPAGIIGRDPSNLSHSLTIDRGLEDGIRVGMPVITSAGLVGRIADAHRTSSRVLLVSDVSSSVSAMIQRTRATGVVQGQVDGNPDMLFVPQDEPVQVGDVVLTAGMGRTFPRRLVIGYVVSAQTSDIELYQDVELELAVDPSRLEMVMVLLSFSQAAVGDTAGAP
jgi:rod shape-determining protein MreC